MNWVTQNKSVKKTDNAHLPEFRENIFPEPTGVLRAIGPGIIWLALAQGSSELIWWPYLTAKYGTSLLFLLIPSAIIQLPLTYHIGRYSMLTGESIWRGFFRLSKSFTVFLWIIMNFSFFWFGSFVVAGGTALSELIRTPLSPKTASNIWGYILIIFMFILLTRAKRTYKVVEIFMTFVAVGTFAGLIISCLHPSVLEKVPEFIAGFFKPDIKSIEKDDYEEIVTAITFMGLGGFWSLFYSYWVIGKGMGMSIYNQNRFDFGFKPKKEDKLKEKLFFWKKALFVDSLIGVVGNLITTIMTCLLAFSILHPKGLFPSGYKIAVVQAEFFAQWWGEIGRKIFLFSSALFLVDTWMSTADAVAKINIDIIKSIRQDIIKDDSKAYFILLSAITLITMITLPIAPPGTLIVFTAIVGFFGMAIFSPAIMLINILKLKEFPEESKPSKISLISLAISSLFYILSCVVYLYIKIKS